MPILYQCLDLFFEVTHGLFVLLVLTGWSVPRLRKLHLAALSLITFSWGVLGAFYGWGYCVCTDVHWQIKEKLGYQNLPASYLSYVAKRYFGLALSDDFINAVCVLLFIASMALTAYLNFIRPRMHKARRRRLQLEIY